MRAFLLFFEVIFAILAFLPAGAGARELHAVGMTFPGVFEQTGDGSYKGLGPELLLEFAKRTGHTIRFENLPWMRSQQMVANGDADILIGPYKTEQRERVFNFSTIPFFQDRILFYGRADRPLEWNGDYASLQNKWIATIHGWAYGPRFDRARPALQLYTTNTLETGLRMLMARRIDLLACDERDADVAISAMRLRGLIISIGKSIDVRDGYFAFSKRSEADGIRLQLDAVLQKMAASGELAERARKYRELQQK